MSKNIVQNVAKENESQKRKNQMKNENSVFGELI